MRYLCPFVLILCTLSCTTENPQPSAELPNDVGALEKLLPSEERGQTKLGIYAKLYKALKTEDPTKANGYLEQQLELAGETGNIEYQGRALHGMGELDNAAKKYDRAVRHYLKAIALFEKVGLADWTAHDYNNIGTVFRRTGIFDEAVPYLEKAVDWYGKAGELHYRAMALSNLAVCQWKKDSPDHGAAEQSYRQAITMEGRLEDRDRGLLSKWSNDFGGLKFSTGDYEAAIGLYHEALDHAAASKEPELLSAMAYANIAEARTHQGREYYPEAEQWIRKALDMGTALSKNPDIFLQVLNIKGELAHRQGRYEAVMGICEGAIARADTTAISPALSETLALLDRTHRAHLNSGGQLPARQILRVKDLEAAQHSLREHLSGGLDQGKLRAVLAKTIDNHHDEVRMTLISAKQSLRMQVFLCVALLLLLMLAVVAVRSRVRKNELDRYIMDNWKAAAYLQKFRKERGLD